MPSGTGRRVTAVSYTGTILSPEGCAFHGRFTNMHHVYYDLVAENEAIVTATTDMCIGPYIANTSGRCKFRTVARGQTDATLAQAISVKDRMVSWTRPNLRIDALGPTRDIMVMDCSIDPAMYNRTEAPPPPTTPHPGTVLR